MGSNDKRAPLGAVPHFVDLRVDGGGEADELRQALAAPVPRIPPKYFYDTLGCRLFEAICELPEYTLTRSERAIFERHGEEIAAYAGIDRPLIDLGAGNCAKAERLLPLLAPSQYVAVDIAAEFLQSQLAGIAQRHPGLAVIGIAQDFATGLALPELVDPGPRTVFYPGSSIGNFNADEALGFLQRARRAAGSGGALILGADLVRAKTLLDLAYDDPLGVTAAFNLNALRHVARVIGADFAVEDWRHVAFFDPASSRVEMHLEARIDVDVEWRGGARRFRATDRIHTENSYKYTPQALLEQLRRAGFTDPRLWTDDERSFAVAVARA